MDHNEESDIFDILGISGREDSYTDLIHSIFDMSDEFKKNIRDEFFEDGEDIKDLNIKIRSYYFTPEGTRKKIIPDIILYNENKLVIIEVKVFSSEGKDQLKSYSAGVEEIKEQLELKDEIEVGKYYLTLDKQNDLPGEFTSMTWKEFADLIPETIDNKFICNCHAINMCIKDLKKRVDDYEDVNIDVSKNFKDIYKWHHFVSYEKILKQIFKDEFDVKWYEWSIWEGWESGENCYAASIQVYCDETWISHDQIVFNTDENDDEVINKDYITVTNNYDIHYEIKIIDNNKIEFRIDYHTNPYLTNNEIKGYGLLHLYDDRRNIIAEFNSKYSEKEPDKLNKAQGKALYVYKDVREIDDGCTVGEFKRIINNLIENNINKVNDLISIIKSYKSE